MVTTGIINGIIHNDKTSLAVIGGRLGYDIRTGLVEKVGEKFFSAASKVGKFSRVLGTVAGPLGVAIDLGLGCWSISKSVDRLRHADNKYDRDDAIADVVSDTVNTVVGVTTAVLSMGFPPFAPVFMAAALVINVVWGLATSIFHAANEVKRTNAEIPLTSSEKEHVYMSHWLDFLGLRQKDYIDYLVEEKKANDLTVKLYLDFLKNNTQFEGVLFPSKTLAYDGGCHQEYKHCWPTATTWSSPPSCDKKITGTGCDFNGPCATGGPCTNRNEGDWYDTDTYRYDCICDKKADTAYGESHKDSFVDFQEPTEVYWDRAVPGDIEGTEFKCKPGSLKNEGFTISQQKQRLDYLCAHAIGLYRPKKERKEEQTFLVNLEDGKDVVLVDQWNDQTSYTYWLGEEGEKKFFGGNARNDFILNGNCSHELLQGELRGGPNETNTMVIAPNCAPGKVIRIESEAFPSTVDDVRRFNVRLEDKLDLQLYSIQTVIGRPKEAERVEVGCEIKRVILNGGASTSNPDFVTFTALCKFHVQIVLANYTKIQSNARRGDVTVHVAQHMSGSSISITRSKNSATTRVIFAQNCTQFLLKDITLSRTNVAFKIGDNWEREPLAISFTDRNSQSGAQHQIFFNESSNEAPNTYSILMVPANDIVAEKSPFAFFHQLQPHAAAPNHKVRRAGNSNIPNIFKVSGRNWEILGGASNDTFILNVPIQDTLIDGGGGDDTLEVLSIQSEAILLNELGNLKGISTVLKGEHAGPIEISPGCDTKAVVVKGINPGFPDIVRVDGCHSTSPTDLQIDAGGATRVLLGTKSCHLIKYKCPIDYIFRGVASCKDPQTVGSGCGWNRPCGPHGLLCKNIFGYDLFKCLCDTAESNNRTLQVLAHNTDKQSVNFELDTNGLFVPQMSLQISLSSSIPPLSVVAQETEIGEKTFVRVNMTGAGLEQVILNFRKDDGTDPFISSPQIQLTRPQRSLPAQLVFERGDTLKPVAVHFIPHNSNKSQQVKGFDTIHNLYQIFNGNGHISGGKVKDTFIGASAALSSGSFFAKEKSDNTLVVKEDEPNSPESSLSFQIDLVQGRMGLLNKDQLPNSNQSATISGAFHSLIGRAAQPDMIVAGCVTRNIAGKGGLGVNLPDLIVIKNMEKFCKDWHNLQNDISNSMEVHLARFTTVENSANSGSFNYFVDLRTEALNHITFSLHPNENTRHKVIFQMNAGNASSQPPVQFELIKFDKNQQILTFHARDQLNNVQQYQFPMYRANNQRDYSNPRFLITTEGENGIISDVGVRADGKVTATYLLQERCHQEMEISGLHVDINNFLISLTSGSDKSEDCGKLLGLADSLENHFWLNDIPVNKPFQINAPQGDNPQQLNALHFAENLYQYLPLSVNLSPRDGYIKQDDAFSLDLVQLRNINSLFGRNSTSSHDTIEPYCSTKLISGVDLINIHDHSSEDCSYNLFMLVDPLTHVKFHWGGSNGMAGLSEFSKSKFNYNFTQPMSFKLEGDYGEMLDGTVHNYHLPLNLDQLDTLRFNYDEGNLIFKVVESSDEEFSIGMITDPGDNDQFYPQPNIFTKDAFKIRVSRDGSVMITGNLEKGEGRYTQLLNIAYKLDVTLLVQTHTEFMYIGHKASNSHRNVIQNLGSKNSILDGNGAANTIYEIAKLYKDVFIDTGLQNTFDIPVVNLDDNITKQTLDLSDIVTPIRVQAGYKYKPSVVQRGDHLAVFMTGYEHVHAGKIVIREGATWKVRDHLQVLLGSAMMEFVGGEGNKWELSPVQVKLEREAIYSIAVDELEYGHHVVVLDHKYGPEYQFRFKHSRNKDDLHLSDIEGFSSHRFDKQHISMTTLIITDFCKGVNSTTGKRIVAVGEKLLPSEIRDVTISMPGLEVKLNGTDLLMLHGSNWENSDSIEQVLYPCRNQSSTVAQLTIGREPNDTEINPVLHSTGIVPEWSSVLHQQEETILQDLPFVRRFY